MELDLNQDTIKSMMEIMKGGTSNIGGYSVR